MTGSSGPVPFPASFPSLASDGFEKTSDEDSVYNCIAWAAGDVDHWWWPDRVWPSTAPRAETLPAFVAAFGAIGYTPCQDGRYELAYEKIAIYCSLSGVPTHAARQLDSGCWTSKLGEFWDIQHSTPRGVEGPQYGIAVQFLRRPLPQVRTATRFRFWSHSWFRERSPLR
jgi:hypothetical protein